jgi:polysaccharide export outer membrane protein
MLISSCGIYNSNQVLTVPDDSSFTFKPYNKVVQEATIQPGDNLSIQFFPNNGEKALFALGSIVQEESNTQIKTGFEVTQQGEITIPMLGVLQVKGLTVKACAKLLEERLAKEIQSPYVEVKISNQHVTLFNGQGAGSVIPLTNEGTTLLEVIALGGGIKEFSKANEITILRLENNVRTGYNFDLSTLKNVQQADIIVQNKDIIIIRHHTRKVQQTMRDASPWISIFTSGLAIFSILTKL